MSHKKTVAITSVRNEEDIIESFVRFSLKIFDHLIINENFSLDSTPEILRKLVEEGLNLEFITDNRSVFPQEKRTNELLDFAMRQYQPDWVFPLDGDEFLFRRDKGKIQDAIKDLDPGIINLFGWDTYVITGKEKESLFIPEKFEYRRKEEKVYYKTCISKELYNKGARLALGSHDINFPSEIVLKKSVSTSLRIAHYPVRSAEQLMNKIIIGVLNKLANYSRNSVINYHQTRIFDVIAKDGYIQDSALKEFSLTYAGEDPVNNPLENMSLLKAPIDLFNIDNSEMNYTKPLDEGQVLSIAIETAAGIIENLRVQKEKLQDVEKDYINIRQELKQKDEKILEITNSRGWKLLENLRHVMKEIGIKS